MRKEYDDMDPIERQNALAGIAECAADRIETAPVDDYRRVAETADGDPADWQDDDACRFCVIGALFRCARDLGAVTDEHGSEALTGDATEHMKSLGLLDDVEPWHSYDYLTGLLVKDPSGLIAAERLRGMAAALRTGIETAGA
ncbi:hypothetical protein [Mycobacterium sp.]|uniref:hypothetical protein n=1 Tax=Mycobacterium sp. TaxID=1785 RepID=UPI00260167F5|nr:hypothetical protein [Mycobacterium sp.]